MYLGGLSFSWLADHTFLGQSWQIFCTESQLPVLYTIRGWDYTTMATGQSSSFTPSYHLDPWPYLLILSRASQ